MCQPLAANLISELPGRKRSIPLEVAAPARSQQNPRFFHAAAVFETDQPVGNSILPDRQMRATPPPSLCVGITARRLRDPCEELMCQCVRGVLHGRSTHNYSGCNEIQAGCSTVRISISDSSVRCTGHLSAISMSRLRSSALSAPSSVIVRSMRSIMPSFVSQLRQSSA